METSCGEKMENLKLGLSYTRPWSRGEEGEGKRQTKRTLKEKRRQATTGVSIYKVVLSDMFTFVLDLMGLLYQMN